MHIGKKNIKRAYKLAYVGGILDLGVNFQSNLQFDKHVANICAKANGIVGIIKHTFSCRNIDIFQILSKSLAMPILEYCSCVWSPYTNVSARKIDQVQRRAT